MPLIAAVLTAAVMLLVGCGGGKSSNTSSSLSLAASAPVPASVSAFAPTSGPVGTDIVVTGTGLNTVSSTRVGQRLAPGKETWVRVFAVSESAGAVAPAMRVLGFNGGAGWRLRRAEAPTKHYYGRVRPMVSAGAAGMGYVNSVGATALAVSSLSWVTTSVAHTPCGGVASPDLNYPYAGGLLGPTPLFDSLSNDVITAAGMADIVGWRL